MGNLVVQGTNFNLIVITKLTYTEFPFEGEATGDNLIVLHQTKAVKA